MGIKWATPTGVSVNTVIDQHVEYVAHHALLLAIPAFLPAVILVGVVLYVALRDRRGNPGKAKEPTDSVDDRRD
jgi:hypothetical protein